MAIRLALATEDFGQPLRQAIRQAAQFRVQGLRLNARTEIGAADLTDTGLRQLRLFVEEPAQGRRPVLSLAAFGG